MNIGCNTHSVIGHIILTLYPWYFASFVEKTLMIYGDADEVIAPASMAKFAVDKGIERHIIKHASHFFHGQLGELKDILNEFAQP